MADDWRPQDTDVNLDAVPDETREYFDDHAPDSITPMSVPSLRDAVDPNSPIEFQRALHDRASAIIDENRDEPYYISMEFETTQHELIATYAHAVPTSEALDYLHDHAPLAELFAGNGYWAHELDQWGSTVEAFDADPPRDAWTTVQKADQDALLQYAERHDPVRLLVCWPPVGPAAYEALLVAQPDDLFFIGERPGDGFKMMADEKFFKSLDARYHLKRTIELPTLQGHMDALHHYTRR